MENIDVTTELLDELELINYINSDTALAIHHNLSELKNSIKEYIGLIDINMNGLGEVLNLSLKAKLIILNKNIKIINSIIEKVHIKPFINIGNHNIYLN